MLPHARTFVQRTIDRIFAEKMAEELTAILFDGTPGRVPVTIPFPDGTFDPRRNPFHE
jgi:hypothetical protein